MNNVDINFERVQDLEAMRAQEEKKKYMENKNLQEEHNLVVFNEGDLKGNNSDLNNMKDIKKLMNSYEKVFYDNEKKYLWKMFLTYSSDNVKYFFYIFFT